MPGLMLKFPAEDRIILNGAVIENVGRSARLRILTPNTQLLRLRDAINPEEVATPVGRLAHGIQLLLIGEARAEEVKPQLVSAIEALKHAFRDPADKDELDRIAAYLAEDLFYQALRRASKLREREAVLLRLDRS
jgi:flagellar protein FlbT